MGNNYFYLKLYYLVLLTLLSAVPFHSQAASPTVTWVYMADAEPINWQENGVAKGIEVEIVEHVLGNLGIKVIHEFYPWQRAQEYVARGKADAMMATPTGVRFQYAAFGKVNVVPNYWNLFFKKGDTKMAQAVTKMTKLEDLKSYKLIDFLGNGWSAAFMRRPGGYMIHDVTRIEQIPLLLALGRCDLTINSSSWINWWAEKQGVQDQIEEYEIDWPWTRFHFVFMVSRKSPWIDKGLIRAMDQEAEKMKASGVWYKILRKYKNPHGFGKPFVSHLDEEYERQQGFYQDYETYPVYQP